MFLLDSFGLGLSLGTDAVNLCLSRPFDLSHLLPGFSL
jgi:hypothetical protein